MRRAVFLILSAALAGCATAGTASDTPSQRAVSAAILNWITASCAPDEATSCLPPPRRIVLTALRCAAVADVERTGQVLCVYSGRRDMRAVELGFAGECAWLSRHPDGSGWRVRDFPDVDICGSAR